MDVLALHPEAIPELAVAFKAHWSPGKPDSHVHTIEAHFERCLNTDRMPVALVAHCGSRLAGVVALLEQSVRGRLDLGPWLGALYVFPAFRRQGIGAMLIRSAERKACDLGIESLFAGTESAAQLFRRVGWEDIGELEEDGEQLTLFKRRVGP